MVDTARKPSARVAPGGLGSSVGDSAIHDWASDAYDRARDYVRARPDQAILLALGIGVVLGWKLRS